MKQELFKRENYHLIEQCCRFCIYFDMDYDCANTCKLDEGFAECYGVCDLFKKEGFDEQDK